MQGVMLSIKPKWCKLIANGEKTIEIRKTMPKLDVPFKCYIYCTKGKHGATYLGGKVIGEFDCNNIDVYFADDFVGAIDADGSVRTEAKDGEFAYWISNEKDICLSYEEILRYGDGKTLYGWYISNLKIYDRPKELDEFRTVCKYRNGDNSCRYREIDCDCVKFDFNPNGSVNFAECLNFMTRPPQSWCHVESEV